MAVLLTFAIYTPVTRNFFIVQFAKAILEETEFGYIRM